MDARETLAMFVAGGNMRDAEPSPTMDAETVKTLQMRLDSLRNGATLPEATAAPSDFRAGIAAREAQVAAAEAASRGADVPRWHADHPVMKQVYRAHDAISSLPAPGGLGGIIFVIFLFFLILIPITSKGETRTLLLWEVLLGQKEVEPIDVPVVDAGTGKANSEQSLIDIFVHAGLGVLGKGDSTNQPNTPPALMELAPVSDSFQLFDTSPAMAGGLGYE